MKKILYIFIPVIIILGIGFGAMYYVDKTIHVPTPKDFFASDEEKEKFNFQEEQGYINILLIGIDARAKDEPARTDSIILATVDTNNKKIKLTSFMRDMYVPIPGHGQNKINSAFFLGGPELLLKTLNQDFQLNVQYYVSIDFTAFQDVVDKLGGVEVDVKDYEIKEINKYIKEVNGNNSTLLTEPGYQKLNGQQALSYCRIRKVGNNDYERTERQRRVLSILIDKMRSINLLKLPEVATAFLPYIKTNVPTTKLMNIAYTAYKFGNTPVETARVPFDNAFDDTTVAGMSVLVPDLEKNIVMLEKFLYSASGTLGSNVPIYMANGFHSNDKAIDRRGKRVPAIKIELPKVKVIDEEEKEKSTIKNKDTKQETNKQDNTTTKTDNTNKETNDASNQTPNNQNQTNDGNSTQNTQTQGGTQQNQNQNQDNQQQDSSQTSTSGEGDNNN